MKLVFKGKQAHSKQISSFIFRAPNDTSWVAGQSIKIEVPGAYGPLEHRFTIASAPYEKLVTITTRLSDSEYKNSLASLEPGAEIDAYSIEGDFAWRESETEHIFVAAGIGITPFHAIIKQRFHDKLPVSAKLIYGSRHEFVYKDVLDEWAKQSDLKVIYVTDRRLSIEDVPASNSYVYVSGPSDFVDEFSAGLVKRGLPENKLVRDWFTGRLTA